MKYPWHPFFVNFNILSRLLHTLIHFLLVLIMLIYNFCIFKEDENRFFIFGDPLHTRLVEVGQMSNLAGSLCEEFWEWRLREWPEFATFCGIHKYDDRLNDHSEEAFKARQVGMNTIKCIGPSILRSPVRPRKCGLIFQLVLKYRSFSHC